MNILFLTISRITEITGRGVYTDLMRKFSSEGHDVFIITPLERRYKQKTNLTQIGRIAILKVKTFNNLDTNILEKGLSTLLIEYQFLNAIKKYFADTAFDLVLYSTPPVTFARVIKFVKKRDGALSYLLLKDIFPQNAVDLGMVKEGGFLHWFFRKKEKDLYSISDYIGCMSQANVDYVRRHNSLIKPEIIEINPNTIEPVETSLSSEEKMIIRQNYMIPENSLVFIYGGNLGKPQGIDFLIEVLRSQSFSKDAFFVIAGTGTDYPRLKMWVDVNRPDNVLLIKVLPRNEFDRLLQACDVGMIFLDKRFTIPNFPSRLLSYLECRMPVIAATDRNTDLGKIITENHFGLWSESGDLQAIIENINYLVKNKNEISGMGNLGYKYLIENYTVSVSYKLIMSHLK